MKPNKASLLLHPVFIVSLTVLLLNDFYWKYAYGNWLTGKLSDVAGLVVFPIFLFEVFRKVSKTFLLIFTILFFTWWKSPLSQPLINIFYSFDIQLHRTIDYTDLFAMAVLPFVYFLKPVSYLRFPLFQETLRHVLGVVAFFALCADTPYRVLPYNRYSPNEVRYSEEFCWAGNQAEILQHLKDKGLTVTEETERYYPLYPAYNELFYRVKTSDTSFQWKAVASTPDSVIYMKQSLYERQYLVAEYTFEGEVFQNIRFRLYADDDKEKIVCARMVSFDSHDENYKPSPNKKMKKKLKKFFEDFFGIKPK